jgi:uncharacterized protein (TIGR01777 family)
VTRLSSVLVTGATGLIGRRLTRELLARGAGVRALTRSLGGAAAGLDPRAVLVRWDGTKVEADAVRGATAVVHLAGEPVFAGPLTRDRRRRIRDSRVESTRSLVEAIAGLPAAERPAVLVCASAVGIYGDRGEEILDEGASPGEGFLAEVCRAWENEARRAADCGVRSVALRIGIVLAREGGALPRLALPFRFGLGGRLGDGRQWCPWIHADDAVALAIAAAENEGFAGPVNAVAPEPVRNAELAAAVGEVLGRPVWLPVPGLALRIALGELAGELLSSRRALPARALARGFSFRHGSLASALSSELTPFKSR